MPPRGLRNRAKCLRKKKGYGIKSCLIAWALPTADKRFTQPRVALAILIDIRGVNTQWHYIDSRCIKNDVGGWTTGLQDCCNIVWNHPYYARESRESPGQVRVGVFALQIRPSLEKGVRRDTNMKRQYCSMFLGQWDLHWVSNRRLWVQGERAKLTSGPESSREGGFGHGTGTHAQQT